MAFCFFGMAVSLLVTIPLFFIKGSRFSPIGYFLLACLNGAAGFVMAYFYVIGSWAGLFVNGIVVAIVWIADILIYSFFDLASSGLHRTGLFARSAEQRRIGVLASHRWLHIGYRLDRHLRRIPAKRRGRRRL